LTEIDEQMMRRALELAARGVGQVSPSPLVGCVVTDAGGAVAGEGCYLWDGVQHAEAIALAQAGARARGGTAYVSLEPHAHQGRTPPCTEALIRAGVRRVVAAVEDANPLVCGRGFAALRAAGLEVVAGVLAEEAARLNEKYIHHQRTGRPFVHLKLACSLDGRIATRAGDSRWITGPAARARVHELRHEYDAILVGSGTARADNPALTDRSGRARRRPLARVVLDERLELAPASQLAQTAREAPVIVFTQVAPDAPRARELAALGVELVAGGRDLGVVLDELARRAYASLLIEGGAGVAGAFLDAGLVNKASFFLAPLIIGGRDAPNAIAGAGPELLADAVRLSGATITQHGPDVEITGYLSSAESSE
jgi:diaminohydroxyphosphoribosylaminopyrimidine deaminase/5-amino-6-(5-phosphoribosylamino)uracil reductase